MNKQVGERIALYKDLLKIFSAYAFAVGGGVVGLLFKLEKPVTVPLLILGLWFETFLIFGIIRTYIKIERLIEELKDE
jgi:Na+-transporting NADH:ubiquinone oxidoreductase subunit NqrB